MASESYDNPGAEPASGATPIAVRGPRSYPMALTLYYLSGSPYAWRV
jgi:hypothetical protein